MKTLTTSLALAFSLLTAAVGCSAPATTNANADACTSTTAADTTVESAAAAPVAKTLVVGSDAEIVERRESVAVRYAKGAASRGLRSSAPSRYIASSGMLFADLRTPSRELAVSLVRSGGALADVARAVESSDPSIATADAVGGSVQVHLTGKLGNAYITTFDATHSATAKFMVLAATPREGTAIVDSAALAPKAMYRWAGNYEYAKVTDFQATTNNAQLDLLYTDTDRNMRGLLAFDDVDAVMREVTRQAPRPTAIYFPDQELLVRDFRVDHNPGHGMSEGITFTALAGQADFERYVDFGGVLTSSLLRDPAEVTGASLELAPKRSGNAVMAAKPVAVVLPDGRRVAIDSPEYASARAQAKEIVMAYSVGDGLESGGLECKFAPGMQVDFKSLFVTAETDIDANATWNHGRPDIGMRLHPVVRVGGQLEATGNLTASCEATLLEIPVAEWGVPVFGNVAVKVPVKAKFEVGIGGDKKVVIMTPRLEIGSKADTTKPGTVGFSYTPGGAFETTYDLGAQASFASIGVVKGSDEGARKVTVEAGVAAGLELEATVKLWVFKATVSAQLGEVLFGIDGESTQTTHDKTYTNDGRVDLGLYPRFAPTVSVATPFFNASFNLFTLDLPNWTIANLAKGESEHDLLPADESHTVSLAGQATKVIVNSDTVEVPSMKSSDKGSVRIDYWHQVTGHGFEATAIEAPLVNGVANFSGVDLKGFAATHTGAMLVVTINGNEGSLTL